MRRFMFWHWMDKKCIACKEEFALTLLEGDSVMANTSFKLGWGVISAEILTYLLFFVTVIDWITVLSDTKEPETYLRVLYIVSIIVAVLIGVILKKGK